MPHVDKRTGEIVIRIVYDGAAEAGKTTNIAQLGAQISLQRRGARESPGQDKDSRRTEYFDWLDFSGGFLDGRRVRCQLVSVPGQPELLHRRRYLLDAADAIVYVADARREFLDEARHNLAVTRRLLAAREGAFPVGVVVQANKQDLPGALGADELARELSLSPGALVVESAAASGDGVMQTFILAGRAATERVRSMIEEIVDSETPEQIYAALRSIDDALALQERAHRVAEEDPPMPLAALPASLEVSAGHVWPPIKGRALLARASLEALRSARPSAWAPADAFELRASNGWILHSASRWLFDDEGEAKLALLTLVRRQLAWSEFLPDCRALFLAADGRAWRIWMLTGEVKTLRESLNAADPRAAQQLTALAEDFWQRFVGVGGSGAPVRVDLDTVSVLGGRLALLALDEGLSVPRPEVDLPTLLAGAR